MLTRWIEAFSLFGAGVRLHTSWLLLAPLTAWTLADTIFPFLVPELSPPAYWQMAVAGTVGLLPCILVREAAHIVSARHAAISIGWITIYVFGGVAAPPAEETRTRQEFLVMFMGSLLAFIFGLAVLALLFQSAYAAMPLTLAGVLFYLGLASWVLALVNLIPAGPFRGGRVLRAALIGYLARSWADRITTALGLAVAFLVAFTGAALVMRGEVSAGLLSLTTGALLYLARREELASSPP